MGCDKALLQLGDSTVIERVTAAAQPLSRERFIVADENEPYEFLGLPIIRDLRKSAGPLAGLEAALRHAASPVVCLLACDLPFLTTEFLQHLETRIGAHQAVIPRSDSGMQPLCAFYSTSCETAIEHALAKNDFRMNAFHDAVDVTFVEHRDWTRYDPHGVLFANLNSPEEYEKAKDLAAKLGI